MQLSSLRVMLFFVFLISCRRPESRQYRYVSEFGTDVFNLELKGNKAFELYLNSCVYSNKVEGIYKETHKKIVLQQLKFYRLESDTSDWQPYEPSKGKINVFKRVAILEKRDSVLYPVGRYGKFKPYKWKE
jgi:hypothetical protein